MSPQTDPGSPSSPAPRRGGRPKAFEGETVKVALFLPPELAGTLKALAAKHHQTPSNLVAEWIRSAEVREAMAQGREGDAVTPEAALPRSTR